MIRLAGPLALLIVLAAAALPLMQRAMSAQPMRRVPHAGTVRQTRVVRHTRHPRPVYHDLALTMPADGPYLHTDGAALRDARGNQVRLSGVNWFGLETCAFAPDGLGTRSWWDWLDQVRALGYNTIRLPFSDQLLDPRSQPQYINYNLNPDLRGLSGLQIMDRIIAGAGARGLRILLDRHRPDCAAQSPLWYTASVSEHRWIGDLVFLAHRYRNQPAVIGIDLQNEPQQTATWGDGHLATDWRLAAERAGNAVLRVNPHWLIFVQGVSVYKGDPYWWGGNLEGAATAPVRLTVPHRLVYEAHDYGPSLYPQGWFSAPNFPQNLPHVWDTHWGYLAEQGIAPVVLGEFGGRTVAPDVVATRARQGKKPTTVRDGIWQRSLIQYLARHPAIGFMYWSLTPDSQDTGGLLNDDWWTASITKQRLLTTVQGAPIPLPHALPAPASPRLLVSDSLSTDGRQQSLALSIVNDGSRPLDLAGAELRYWLAAFPGGTVPATATTQLRTADVDWSSIGPNTITAITGTAAGRVYLALRMQAAAGAAVTLAPYGGVASVALRLHRPDWAPYSPTDDWSYLASTVPVPAEHVTLALHGHSVWGASPPTLRVSLGKVQPPRQAHPARHYRFTLQAE
jgi:endoglucanase